MGKLADAIRGVSLPAQKQTQLLRLDTDYVELESQLASFQEQNNALDAENKELKKKNKILKDDIARLEGQLKARTSSKEKSVVHHELDELEKEVILYLSHVRREDCTTRRIASGVSVLKKEEITPLKAEVCLTRLEKRGFVLHLWNLRGTDYSHWILDTLGKEYSVLHGLDKRP